MNHVNDKRKKRETLRDFNQRDVDEGREKRREDLCWGEDDGEDLETVNLD
jgi:hypothetical protein